MPVISAAQDMEAGRLEFEASLGKNRGPYFQNEIYTKGLRV
jgi:hypothetical protein